MSEEYTYKIGNQVFIVTPVYKDDGAVETVKDILLKLMRLEAEGILYCGDGQRYNIGGNTDCLTAGRRSM